MDTKTAIWLEPKTRKASNRLQELTDAIHQGASVPAGPQQWQIVGQQSRVGFDAGSGPWLLVQPITGPHIAEKFQRWVHATNDRDFALHEA